MCNYDCIHCRAANNISRSQSLERGMGDYMKVIKQFSDMQIYKVGITGGEPFLHSYIFEIIEECKKYELSIVLYTNASLIDYHKAEKLSGILDKSDIVHVSLDGGNEHDNDMQRGKGAFQKTIAGLENLSKFHIPTRLTCVPTVYNIDNLSSIIDIAVKYGVKEVSAVPLMCAGRAEQKKLAPEPMKLMETELRMLKKAKNTSICYMGGVLGPVSVYKHFPEIGRDLRRREGSEKRICDAGTCQLFIDAVGQVFPCNLFAAYNEFAIGNVFKDELSTIWKSDLLNSFKNGFTMKGKCKKCDLWNLCTGGCVGLSYIKYKKLDEADPRCTD